MLKRHVFIGVFLIAVFAISVADTVRRERYERELLWQQQHLFDNFRRTSADFARPSSIDTHSRQGTVDYAFPGPATSVYYLLRREELPLPPPPAKPSFLLPKPLAPLLFIATISAIVGLKGWSLWNKRRRPAAACPTCGYDLRASPIRCPECGRPASLSSSRSVNDPALTTVSRV